MKSCKAAWRLGAAAILSLASCSTFAAPSGRTDIPFGPGLEAQGWTPMTFMTIPATAYRADGPGQVDIRAEKSSSLIYRPIPPVRAPSSASWRWRLDRSAPPTDLSRKGGDDRPLALYFLFADDEAAAKIPASGLMDAMRRGRVLVYVWGGSAQAGASFDDPYLRGRGAIVVKRAGDAAAGEFVDEVADLSADFRRAFGTAPGPLTGIAISSDSDDTESVNAGAIADLTVLAD
jgi:hypothetical protein